MKPSLLGFHLATRLICGAVVIRMSAHGSTMERKQTAHKSVKRWNTKIGIIGSKSARVMSEQEMTDDQVCLGVASASLQLASFDPY